MQITSAVGQSTTFSKVSTASNTPSKDSVRSFDVKPVEKIEKEQSSNKQASLPIIDEQAIALFEEAQASQQAQSQSTQAQLTQSQSTESRFFSASQDQPSAKNETAVASYQAIGNQAQRESVQQLFGVDLFA